MSDEIDFVLHNAFADTWWVLLKDSRCAHLMFRSLWDVNPNADRSTTTSQRSIAVGVSYDLGYDKAVDIYGDFVAPYGFCASGPATFVSVSAFVEDERGGISKRTQPVL